jgi:hypothetical protein
MIVIRRVEWENMVRGRGQESNEGPPDEETVILESWGNSAPEARE